MGLRVQRFDGSDLNVSVSKTGFGRKFGQSQSMLSVVYVDTVVVARARQY